MIACDLQHYFPPPHPTRQNANAKRTKKGIRYLEKVRPQDKLFDASLKIRQITNEKSRSDMLRIVCRTAMPIAAHTILFSPSHTHTLFFVFLGTSRITFYFAF